MSALTWRPYADKRYPGELVCLQCGRIKPANEHPKDWWRRYRPKKKRTEVLCGACYLSSDHDTRKPVRKNKMSDIYEVEQFQAQEAEIARLRAQLDGYENFTWPNGESEDAGLAAIRLQGEVERLTWERDLWKTTSDAHAMVIEQDLEPVLKKADAVVRATVWEEAAQYLEQAASLAQSEHLHNALKSHANILWGKHAAFRGRA